MPETTHKTEHCTGVSKRRIEVVSRVFNKASLKMHSVIDFFPFSKVYSLSMGFGHRFGPAA